MTIIEAKHLKVLIPIPVKVPDKLAIGLTLINCHMPPALNHYPCICLGICRTNENIETFISSISKNPITDSELSFTVLLRIAMQTMTMPYNLSVSVRGNKEFQLRLHESVELLGMVPSNPVQLWLKDENSEVGTESSNVNQKDMSAANISFLAQELRFVVTGVDQDSLLKLSQ